MANLSISVSRSSCTSQISALIMANIKLLHRCERFSLSERRVFVSEQLHIMNMKCKLCQTDHISHRSVHHFMCMFSVCLAAAREQISQKRPLNVVKTAVLW